MASGGDLSAVDDLDPLGRSSRAASDGLDLVHDVHAFDDLAKDDVPAVQPARDDRRDEELASVRVRAGVRHAQNTWKQQQQKKV